jgi:hypothetical protein
VLTDPAARELVDTGLDTRSRYFYRIFVYSTHDVGTGSEEVQATTLGVGVPFADDFETSSSLWTLGGAWGREAGLGRDGGSALTDGPGVYGNNSDTSARFGVDLHGMTWPVLLFHEKHDFQTDGDWGRVEVSSDFGASWTGVLAVSGASTGWTRRAIDLSPWRLQPYVWIRFRVTTDGGTSLNGFTVDDLALAENSAPPRTYPFFDGFEEGLDAWLPSQWSLDSSRAHTGGASLESSPGSSNAWSGWFTLTLADSLDLEGFASPSWTFYVRGSTGYQQSIRAQVSTDGGVGWADLWATGIDYASWNKVSLPLDGWRRPDVRFRFAYTGGCCVDREGVSIDDVGIGGPEPGAPTPQTPAAGSTVDVHRPALVVKNAFDPQTDPLTYNFEVYSDEALTQRVAQVPAVASGVTSTGWTVDVDLADNGTYWWRCRASDDGAHVGPWTEATRFTVVLLNDPPSIPAFVAPPNGATLWGADATLTWYRSEDPNPNDSVRYDLQIDDDPSFRSPEVDERGILTTAFETAGPHLTVTMTLGELTGFTSLHSGTVYYWRLRALDDRAAASPWTTEARYFHYGRDEDPPAIAWVTPDERGVLVETPATFSGTAADAFSGMDYVQVSVDGGETWDLAAGAGSWSFAYRPAQNGPLTVLARGADRAGNISAAVAREFTVALPDIPRDPRAFSDNSVVSVVWTAPSLPGATGYNVYRSTIRGEGWVRLNTIPVSATHHRDAGLSNGTGYYYVVTALYGTEPESGLSPEVFARPFAAARPPFVDDLTVRRSESDLVLEWTPVTTDPGTGAEACAGYWVYEGSTPAFTPETASSLRYVSGASSTTFAGAFADGARRFFHVTAADDQGQEGFWTQWFAEENHPALVPGTGWTRRAEAEASGGGCLVSAQAGAVATFTFRGTGVSVMMRRGPDQGMAQVRLDGSPMDLVDLYAPEPTWGAWTFHARDLADGQHALEVVATGQKNAASSGIEVNLDRILSGR